MHDLGRESATFAAALPGLLEGHRGEYALVHGDRVLGTFPSESDALLEGYRRLWESRPFLVKRIVPREEEVPAFLGAASLLA